VRAFGRAPKKLDRVRKLFVWNISAGIAVAPLCVRK